MASFLINILVLSAVIGITLILYMRRVKQEGDVEFTDELNIPKMLEIIKQERADMVRIDERLFFNTGRNSSSRLRSVSRISKAFDEAPQGIDSAVEITRAINRDILERQLDTMERACVLVDFMNLENLPDMIKWEILLYRLGKVHKKNTIYYLDDMYHITQMRLVNDACTREVEGKFGYELRKRVFDSELLRYIFRHEVMDTPITYEEALDILAIMFNTINDGFGCVATLRSLNIDGMNFGTSGSIRYLIDGNLDEEYKFTNSVWVQINATWTHFSFLDFGTEGEMKRVINMIMAWGTSAPMSEMVPGKVNDMYDGSRVTAFRTSAGECWAIFIRKFSLSKRTVEDLINNCHPKNAEIPLKLIYFIMRGEVTSAFTGQQNTGKTTMMAAAIAFCRRVNIRILEMSFELQLRELYKDRNIFTAKPGGKFTNSTIQDLLKKTDAYISMVGEVAEDIVVPRMIQFCLVASACTYFSHHGRDDFGLVNGLANSMVASGEYENHDVAISVVLDAIKSNVHLGFWGNNRVIEYISEIIKLDEIAPYPELPDRVESVEEAILSVGRVAREYYTRTTDRVRFESVKIMRFDPKTGSYMPGDWYSPEMEEKIKLKLDDQDLALFGEFYYTYWGRRGKGTAAQLMQKGE